MLIVYLKLLVIEKCSQKIFLPYNKTAEREEQGGRMTLGSSFRENGEIQILNSKNVRICNWNFFLINFFEIFIGVIKYRKEGSEKLFLPPV